MNEHKTNTTTAADPFVEAVEILEEVKHALEAGITPSPVWRPVVAQRIRDCAAALRNVAAEAINLAADLDAKAEEMEVEEDA